MAKEKHNHHHDTHALLKCGVAAGPLYIAVGLFEIFTRPGFDVTRHSLSLMSIGPQGWIHILLFIVCGLLLILGAFGIRSAIHGEKAGTWGPLMIGLYGVGLIAAGIFVPDPMKGFPLGMTYGTISTSGIMHLVAGMVGFIGLIAACFVFARRFESEKKKDLATFSTFTGFIFLVSFIGIAGFSQMGDAVATAVNLAFYFAVVLSWIWLSKIFSLLTHK